MFLLVHNKFNEIIKSMMNEGVANQLMSEYGGTRQEPSEEEQFKIRNSLRRFTMLQVLLG
jgi:hypothetical protein